MLWNSSKIHASDPPKIVLWNFPKIYASDPPPKSCCEIPLKIIPQILPQNHAVKFTQKLSLHSLPKNIFRKSPPKYPPKKLGNSLPPKISGSVPKNPKNWMSIQTSIRRNPSKPKKPRTNLAIDETFQNFKTRVQKLLKLVEFSLTFTKVSNFCH